jgi:hypothetical protein
MLDKESVGEHLVRSFAIILFLFVAAEATGANWCRNNYPHSHDTNPNNNEDYCAANGGIWFLKTIRYTIHENREDLVASGTIILAIFTIVLALAARQQAILTRDAVEAAITTARIAERALTELEAPHAYIRVRTSGIALRVINESRSVEFGDLLFDFINYGRTPSHITEFFTDTHFSEEEVPPPITDLTTVDRTILPWGVVAAPNGGITKQYIHNIPPPFLEGRPAFFTSEAERFYFFGFFRYTDIFGGNYVSGFCFLFNQMDNSFIRAGGDEYNYRRKET